MPTGNPNWVRGKSLDLFVESYSSVAHTVQIRGFSENEQIIASHTTNSDRSLATSTHQLTEVPQHITLRTLATGVKRGTCYVKVSLRAEGVIVALLGSGYVTDAGTVVWPGGLNESSVEGQGLIRSITGTDPAAGVEISETVPTGARWRVKNIRYSFVTDATVGNRIVRVEFNDGTNIFWRKRSVDQQAASVTANYNMSEVSLHVTTSTGENTDLVPPNNRLMAGYIIKTNTSLLQAGDNFSAPQLLVEEWIEP